MSYRVVVMHSMDLADCPHFTFEKLEEAINFLKVCLDNNYAAEISKEG